MPEIERGMLLHLMRRIIQSDALHRFYLNMFMQMGIFPYEFEICSEPTRRNENGVKFELRPFKSRTNFSLKFLIVLLLNLLWAFVVM